MYFEEEGRINTETAVELAIKTAKKRKIKNIVVASSTGETASNFKGLKEFNVVCVTHAYGFLKPGENDMSDETRSDLSDAGIKVLTAGHALSGAERGLSKKFSGIYPVEVIANALRMFGQGVKVCVEISVMALDSGLIPYNEPVIVVGGTGYGADTVVILTPSYSSSILNTRIHEIICKPV